MYRIPFSDISLMLAEDQSLRSLSSRPYSSILEK